MVATELTFEDSFLKEEIRNGYVVSTKMKHVWAVELDLLNKLLQVCKTANLHCFVDSGTLLGTIRHHGFIPWDDDIDVVMFRDDFNKLEEIAEKKFRYPYFFQTAFTDQGYCHCHAQLRNSETTAILAMDAKKNLPYNQGIFIDIFIYDGVSANPNEMQWQIKKLRFYNKLLNYTSEYKANLNWRGRLIKFALNLNEKNRIRIMKKINSILTLHHISECNKVSLLCILYDIRRFTFDKHLYDETMWMDFENIKVPVPKCYDQILKQVYGDYMTPRQEPSWHSYVNFDTENSFTESVFL